MSVALTKMLSSSLVAPSMNALAGARAMPAPVMGLIPDDFNSFKGDRSLLFVNEINPGPQGYFDPLGLVANGDQVKFDRLRYVEIKHGRICQLAFLHQVLIANGITLPGQISATQDLDFADVSNGWAGSLEVPAFGAIQILLFVGILEGAVMKQQPDSFPGDMRNGFDFGWDKLSAEQQTSKRGIELNNGRAAMMGVLGLMMHEQVTGDAFQPLTGIFDF